MTERIIRAAIRTPDGIVTHLPTPMRHHDIIRRLAHCGYGAEEMTDQGFLTDTRRFVDRVEGLAIAEAAGQIKHKHGDPHKLYSEDVW